MLQRRFHGLEIAPQTGIEHHKMGQVALKRGFTRLIVNGEWAGQRVEHNALSVAAPTTFTTFQHEIKTDADIFFAKGDTSQCLSQCGSIIAIIPERLYC